MRPGIQSRLRLPAGQASFDLL